jgi:hypothetical protein
VKTDNKSLELLNSFLGSNSGRLAQWRLFLSSFMIEINYPAGNQNKTADYLSSKKQNNGEKLAKDDNNIYSNNYIGEVKSCKLNSK